jgi:5-methylphenazine-1-carboxylate 1-monooxygenase
VRIAIIGGGICGLALALGLHRHGLRATVYEAAPEIKEIGVGITLLPHAMQEIATLGLMEPLQAAGIENRQSAFFNRFGQQIFSEARGLYAGYATPEIGIHRGRLHAILYRAVQDRLGAEAVITDQQLSHFAQTEDCVTLFFHRHSGAEAWPPVKADIVIACDGVNSVVRKQLYPNDRIAFTGINTWRGVTRRKPILDGRTYLRVGALKTGKMVIYPIRDFEDGTQLINWVAELERSDNTANDWNAVGRRQDVLPIFESFRFDWLDVAALIENAETILEYPMVDKDPIDQWSFGRITLAGDAAHPMYPRGSNGSAQALIDARTLSDLLAHGGDPVAAFKAYEAERRPKTSRIVETNRTSPPDIINIRVEELVGDRPFDNLDDFISQQELKRLSDAYKQVAGFGAPNSQAAVSI